jgi:hypothetical protein
VKTVEKIEAKNLVCAQDKAFLLTKPKTLEGCEIEEPIGGGLDWKAFNKMYPQKPMVDPMEGWKRMRDPGPYSGGQWEGIVYGCKITITGDTGPIEVGMGSTTYCWNVSKPGSDADLISNKNFDKIEEARDAGLKAAKLWSKI